MSEEDQAVGTPTEKVETVKVEQIELGEGNILTKDDAVKLISNNKNLLGELTEARKTSETIKGQLDEVTRNYNVATQSKIQVELERDAAQGEVNKLKGITQNYISPEKYDELQKEVGTMQWNTLVNRVNGMSKEYGIDVTKLHGKSSDQLDAMEEGLKLTKGQPKTPTVDTGTGGQGGVSGASGFQQTIDKNKELIAELRAKGKRHEN